MIEEDLKSLAKYVTRCKRKYSWIEAEIRERYPDFWREIEQKFCENKRGRPNRKMAVQAPEKLLTISKQKKPTRKKAVKKKSRNPDSHLTGELIAFWCKEYRAVYGNNPPMPGKQQGVLRRLHKDFGLERAKLYLEAYLRIKEQWYVKKRHSLDQLESNLNAVEQFISNGRIVTSKTAQQIETDQHNQAAMEAASNDGSIPF